jgi:5'-methylthioadenosine phosphorylase
MGGKVIGVIGGSGLYEMEGLEVQEEVSVDTPYGKPSDNYIVGTLDGQKFIFLPRHGRGHLVSPSEINFRANIYGMKKLGAQALIAISAAGSLQADIEPGHMVVIDQFIDRTKARPSTFFEGGVVAHLGFADPVCSTVRELLIKSAKDSGATVHEKGTYLCMEGPQFSTRAESHMYRQWGAHVIGMTNLQEAKLAREAELCYATLALSTDYDCWHEGHDDVTVEAIIAVLNKNAAMAKTIIKNVVPHLNKVQPSCTCCEALKNAIITDRSKIPAATKEKLALIAGKYL